MVLQQVVDLAKNSELSGLSIKNDNTAIVGFINLGLIELYKRFPISVKEQIIELVDGQEIYDLASDCMWITGAYGELDEHDAASVNILPINKEDDPLSINTVSWNQVQVPLSIDGAYISLIYVAAPPYLTEVDLASNLALPVQMVEALLHYVGYRAHAALDGNIQAENNTHYSRFEASCKRIERQGMFTGDNMDMDDRNMLGGLL